MTWYVPCILILLLKLNNLQPFRFVERPAVRGFITYLNHTLLDNDIPKKSAMANSVNGKVLQLEESTLDIIKVGMFNVLLMFAVADLDQMIANPIKGFYYLGWMVHP